MVDFRGVFKEGRTYSGVLAPRNGWKTGIATIGDATHEMMHNPDMLTQICSESMGLGKLALGSIKAHCERNEKLRFFYGNHVSKTMWNRDAIISAQRTSIDDKEPTIEVLGLSGAIVGRRANIQWLDDPVSQKNSATADMREKHVAWYDNVFNPILNPGGEQRVRGTRYFAHDLYNTLMKYYGKDMFLVIPAILTSADQLERSYWPDRFPLEVLLQMRQKNPVSFALQYMNNVKFLLNRLIELEFLRVVKPGDIPPFNEMLFYIGIDPACKMDGSGSYFTSCTGGQHQKTGLIYILRERAVHLATPEKMLNFIREEYHYVKSQGGVVRAINSESNAFQRVLGQSINAEPMKYGILPFTQSDTGVNKEMAFIAQSKWINMDLVRFTPETFRLVEDIAGFPDIDIKDRVDAFVRLLESLDALINPSLLVKLDPYLLSQSAAAFI
jgi:hypothetical protein